MMLKGAVLSLGCERSMNNRGQRAKPMREATKAQVSSFPFIVRAPIFESLSLVSFLSGVREEKENDIKSKHANE
jgi:hypothetical protein